jgi:hypothetical protein
MPIRGQGATIAADAADLDGLIAQVLHQAGRDVRAAADRILATIADDARCVAALERLADLTACTPCG